MVASEGLLGGVVRLLLAGFADGDDPVVSYRDRAIMDDVAGGVHGDDIPTLDRQVDVFRHGCLQVGPTGKTISSPTEVYCICYAGIMLCSGP